MSDKDYLDAVARYLGADSTLWSLIDGKIHVNWPDTAIASEISSDNMSMISVSFASRNSQGRMGAATHKLKEVDVVIQVDVASLYGNNADYCDRIAGRVEDLVFFDIDYTLNSVTYHIFVDSVDSTVFWDDEIHCWHGVVSINGHYTRTAT